MKRIKLKLNAFATIAFVSLSIFLFSVACRTSSVSHSQDTGKQVALRLEPGPDNPRNSEGDFIELKDGRILFVYSRYFGTKGGDHSPAYLAGRYSSDGGKTWTSEDVRIVEREGKMNVMSVSLLRLKNGEIAMFYLKKDSEGECIPVVRFSKDEAKSWSDPLPCITDKKGYFVLNNDRVIQLSGGRLLMAVNLYMLAEGSTLQKGSLWSYYSDDNGRTWTSGEMVPNPDDYVTQEPGVVELRNGDIMMFIRANPGVQCLSWSKDKGITWSPVVKSDIKSPLSPASIERIPKTGDLLLVWNNNGGENPALKGKRTPLTVAISKDEGKTWENVKNIEDDPDGWYCYTAIHFTKNDVLLGHCAGNRPKGTGLAVTQITKLDQNWLYK
jgi:sialidase-1